MNAAAPLADAGGAPDPMEDALLAARLFLAAPARFGGMVLRGSGPARDALIAALGERMAAAGRPWRRLPGHVDDERLLGGIDIAASLAAGRAVAQSGLVEEAAGGALVAPMAERIEDGVAGRLAQALDEGAAGSGRTPALVLLDDSTDPDECPPASLIERLAFSCDLAGSRMWQDLPLPDAPTVDPVAVAPLSDEALGALAATGEALGVASLRALLFASEAARVHAALAGRSEAIEADLAAAVRLVLAPRATRLPPAPQEDQAQQPDQPPPEPPPPDPGDPPEPGESEQGEDERQQRQDALEEMLVEAAEAAIPADLLEQLAQGNAPRRTGGASGTGQKKKARMRGKPLGARPGMPRGGNRLALIDTLRAAVPWQQVRRRERARDSRTDAGGEAPILMRKEDLRIRRYEEKAPRVTIFAVDASGSAAAARLAEAKGAVELMLAQAYVTRSEVALVAFRGETAELLLPPTRSLTRAKRALSGLPGGGGTPLALGLKAARECAESAIGKGRTASLVILTDGRANIDANGQPGRRQAGADAEAAAKAIAARGIEALVVDISPRPAREGPALAEALRGRFLALPRADAKTLQTAITAAQPGARRAAA
ncbi:magnesium chelatase subunit D [Erythrobacter sp. HL-111]|uniref:magnesium chelatase subunit D n=1 Tax=Erythrobacter sp. HL-111 TaxID=1798193 RepID=UPI0006DB6321|nr:magnesium chelatase subunit D [Erythrobacter sp. HL-111]KPP93915.1 MAG: magnesium chelatase subunit BchD [Erythrobacteraceae bacterium HL-111]SDS33736.1 magnesium chelatase subunit D [Erythrobacter sp. HL-111]